MAAMGKTTGGGFSPVVQTTTITNSTTATSQVATMAASATGNAIVFIGVLKNGSVAGSAVSLAFSDNMASAGWNNISTDPGGGSGVKVFIAWNMAPTAGVTSVTVTFTGGSMQILGSLTELHGASSAGSSATHSSAGTLEAAGGPVVLTNGAANTTTNAVAFHVCSVDLFSNTIALVCTPGAGTFVVTASNQQAQPVSTALATGVMGYTLDTAIRTDSVSDAWTASQSYIASLNKTILF